MDNTHKFVLFIFCLLFPFWLIAQEVTIKGTVKDEDGIELPGATVVIKGTAKGTATDWNGNFEMKAHQGDILVFSTIGYLPKEVKVGKEHTLHIVLSTDEQQIEGTEVVAVAYGTTNKKSFTGSMATVKAETIQAKQTTDVAKTLEGAVAGVQISTSSGQPGSSSSIRIRGIGSINASSAPLIILDGVPFEGTLNAINNSDIESVNVLKDASSSALYGARGANGVVLITTKSGSKGRLSISVDNKLGFNYRGIPEYDIISSPGEYYETLWSALYNQNLYTQNQADALARSNASNSLIDNVGAGYNIYNVADDKVVLPTTGKLNPAAAIRYSDAATFNQWEKALFNSRVRKEHNLSMTKGTEHNSFYFSFGYLGDEGYNMNSYFNRYSTRFAYKGDITSWLKANASSMITYTEKQGSTESNSYDNPFAWTRTIAPIYPIYEHDANGNRLSTYDYGITRKFNDNTNPVATQNENLNYSRNYYFNQALSLDAQLHKNLTFSVNGNFYANFYDVNYFTTPLGGAGKNYGGASSKYKSDNIVMTFNQLLRYSKNWDNYGIEALFGHESYQKRFGTIEGSKKNFVDPRNSEFNNAAVLSSLTSYTRRYFVEGYFGQLNANYQQKYYLSASLRRDGSSVFAPENRWGTFWSVGASWLLSEEKFLEKVDFVDLVKLKLSYGVQGNDELYLPGGGRSYVPYMTLYSVSTNGNTPGLVASYKGNRNITWEESGNLNAGIELGFFRNRLTLEADYFVKKTKDLLFNMPLPASTGFSSEPRNVANMVNKGVEFSLGVTPVQTDKVQWTVSINGLHYKNEITRLPGELREKGLTRGYQTLKEGGSIYDFYLVKWGGVNPTNGDAQFYVKNATTGEYELKGSADYDSSSKQYAGTSIPDLQGGFGTTLSAYNFDLAVQFSYQLGGKFYDYQYAGLMHSGDLGRTWHTDIRNRWTPENTTSDIPRLEFANQKMLNLSDRFMVSSDYLSLRNISLGYTFTHQMVEKLGLTKLRYYLTADNVYLWSHRKGLDPRTSLAGSNDYAVYSPIRTVSMGLTLTF